MSITPSTVIGSLVAEDYRAAEVFAKYGIDFCCKGNLTISEVSEKKNLKPADIVNDLTAVLQQKSDEGSDYQSWPLDLLADYIEKKHHRYVEQKGPVIQQYLAKVVHVHGKAHPELYKVQEEFTACLQALATHMKKEELVLFPFLRKLATAPGNERLIPHFGTVANPIAMMREEHDTEGERLRRISALTAGYVPPAGACNTYRVTYAMLEEFEKDLHKHVHLENNILFPKALRSEAANNTQSCAI